MAHKIEETFAAIEPEFRARVERMVWCSVATVDEHNRPVSRVLHPIWDTIDGQPVAWIATYRHSAKSRHLAQNPYVSMAYVAEWQTPLYVDGIASWDDDLAAKAHVWGLFLAAPEPLGYDPAPLFGGPENPQFVVLRLTPSRIALVEFPAPPGKVLIWRPSDAGQCAL